MNGETSDKDRAAAPDPGQWQYHASSKLKAEPSTVAMPEFTWTASEYVSSPKSLQWYMALATGTLLLTVGIYIWTKDVFSVVAIIIMVTLLGIFGARKPKIIEYKLTSAGIGVATKVYLYKDFRSFSIIDEDAFSSVQFLPLKRFMPLVSIYYDPADEERILDILMAHLPMDERPNGSVEHLARRIRY